MSELIELVYASRSTIKGSDTGSVEPAVARILTQSRRNNTPKEIGGVLCYGDGHFFQCLEGERVEVEQLYEKLHEDDRHRDVSLLRKGPIAQRRFKLWAMKYLSVDRDIRKFLSDEGMQRFDPFALDDARIDSLLEVLRTATEATRHSGGDRPAPSDADRADGRLLGALGVGAVAAALVVIGLVVFVIL
jgi:hypothetical protein